MYELQAFWLNPSKLSRLCWKRYGNVKKFLLVSFLCTVFLIPLGVVAAPATHCHEVRMPEGFEAPCPTCPLTPRRANKQAWGAPSSADHHPEPTPASSLTRPRSELWGSGIRGLVKREDDPTHSTQAQFITSVLNSFVMYNQIKHVIEFGYSWGNEAYQDRTRYPKYTGYDSNMQAWKLFYSRYAHDPTKVFKMYNDYLTSSNENLEKGDLSISLDVLHHISDFEAEDHLRTVFASSKKFVIIFALNQDMAAGGAMSPGRHRLFTEWVDRELKTTWKLLGSLTNRFPAQSGSDFFIYKSLAWDRECGHSQASAEQQDQEEDDEVFRTFKWWSAHPGSSSYSGPQRHAHVQHGRPLNRMQRPGAVRARAYATPTQTRLSARTTARTSAGRRASVETAARNMGSHYYSGRVIPVNNG